MSEAAPTDPKPLAVDGPSSPRWLLVGLAAVLAVYVVLALWFAQTRSVWSPDCGARLIQVQSVLKHGPDWSVFYPAQDLDPYFRNDPLAFYDFRHGGKIYIFYSFLFALITAPLFGAFGFFGLAIPAILGGLGSVAATWALARRLRFRYPLAPALITGLATPLALYSVVFWDHALLAAIATFSLYLALRGAEENRASLWLGAGLLLGGGVWFHEILAPYIPAVLVGAWWLRSRHAWLRNSAYFILGALLLIVPLALINARVYGSPAGPHLANNKLGSASSILQFLLNPSEWGLGVFYSLFGWGDTNPAYTWQLKSWLSEQSAQGQRLREEMRWSYLLAIPVLLWLPVALSGLWKRWGGWLAAAVLLGMLWPAFWVLRHDQFPHSPFYATPVLVFAFLAPLIRSREESSGPGGIARPLLQAVALVTLAYTSVTLLKPTLGGTEWGSRHLLSVLPALVLLGWGAVEWLLSTRTETVEGVRWHPAARPVLAVGALLLILSVVILGHGMRVAHNMHANSRRLTDALLKSPDEVIVATSWWPPLNAAAAYPEKKFVFAGDMDHPAPQLFTRMRSQNVRTFTVLGYNPNYLRDFAMAVGYAPIEGTAQPLPMNLWTQRYALVAAPTDAELLPPPPGETLPPLN